MALLRISVFALLVAGAACFSAPRLQARSAPAASAMAVRPRVHLARAPAVTVAEVRMADAGAAPAAEGGLLNTLKVGALFGVWYAFNIVYNISNKKILNALPCARPLPSAAHARGARRQRGPAPRREAQSLPPISPRPARRFPWTMSVMQLGVGLFYLIPLWMTPLRKAPKLSAENIKAIAPIATMHAIGHLCTVISLGAGAVSFTHIVKAAEPFFSTVMSAIFTKVYFPVPVYLALLPVVGGVGIASLTELSFSWVAFLNAMGSNTAFSLRAIFSKKAMEKPQVRRR